MTTTAELPGPEVPGSFRSRVDVFWVGDGHAEPDPFALSPDRAAVELQAIQQRRARDTAREAELILGMAGARPARTDPLPGTSGARKAGWSGGDPGDGISEFFTAELATVINLGRTTASKKLDHALTWQKKLPRTFAALKAGELDEPRARALADVLMHTNAAVARQVEDALLPEASDLSVYKLRDRATELMVELDAKAADLRREEAEKTADVHLYPSATDGRSTIATDLPTDEAVECYDIVDQLAKMLKADGDPRRIGALRAHVLSRLIRRPADHGLPAVAANVTVAADLDALGGTGSTPGEVDGLPITAAHVRELLARVGALGLTAPDGGTLTFAITGPDGQLLATLTPTELTRLARRGCPQHPETPCDCPVTGPPPATGAYQPTARQRAFTTTRDRRCRFPNCGQRVGWTDLDHVTSAACGGATDCANLCCLCRSHHRLKTFAPGWRFTMTPDGVLQVTTPSGVTRTTRPPGMRPPPTETAPEPPAPSSDDDPPPF
ncbi:HNH endonuclease signature motif containing protein [Modestobacter altitudinis]|uniref:HNH endonuclease signature motif containing protein n=1 Tax=Modestobacter altitudinis TaxID=2213158 RepID=UPI00110D09DE|nr:HNH endonuclease signature motif containing protein [Modestobacter altitudinis]